MGKIQNTHNNKWWQDVKQELSSLLVKMQNDTATLEESLLISFKTKQSYHMIQKSSSFAFI